MLRFSHFIPATVLLHNKYTKQFHLPAGKRILTIANDKSTHFAPEKLLQK